jgi:hypothetical protein
MANVSLTLLHPVGEHARPEAGCAVHMDSSEGNYQPPEMLVPCCCLYSHTNHIFTDPCNRTMVWLLFVPLALSSNVVSTQVLRSAASHCPSSG